MSTRACYLFSDDPQTGTDPKAIEGHVVFKHHDGYPTGAIEFLDVALSHAWPLPRFEADEFAAAFVSASKDGPGGVRLCGLGKWTDLAPGDIEYLYITRPDKRVVIVSGYSVNCDWRDRRWTAELLFEHPLATIGCAKVKAS